MKIEIFCLCDAATENHGKLNILGAFDTIAFVQIPGAHHHCAVGLRMRFEASELGPHHIKVNFIDSDGTSIIQPAEGDLNVNLAGSANLILNIYNLHLHKSGEYAIDLNIDGHHCATVPLFIKQIQPVS